MKTYWDILEDRPQGCRDLFISLKDDPRSYLEKNKASLYIINNNQIRSGWIMESTSGNSNNFIHINIQKNSIRLTLLVGDKSHWIGSLLKKHYNKEKGTLVLKIGELIPDEVYQCIRDANEYGYRKFNCK